MSEKTAKQKLAEDLKNLLAQLQAEEEVDVIEESKPEETLAVFDLENGEDVFASEFGKEECEEKVESEKTASVEEKGIEDEIKDTATGDASTVKEVVPEFGTEVAPSSDKEVFPTDSKNVETKVEAVEPVLKAKVAKVLSALDEAAEEFEKCGDYTAALAFDACAENIEEKFK